MDPDLKYDKVITDLLLSTYYVSSLYLYICAVVIIKRLFFLSFFIHLLRPGA
jgi:hypothetical protein